MSLGHLLSFSDLYKQTQALLLSRFLCLWFAHVWLALQRIFWAFSLCVGFLFESSVFL